MSGQGRVYSFDTSGLIDGLERLYPEDHFPSIWKEIETLVSAGRLKISEEVWEEAKKRAAVAQAWCARYLADILVPTDSRIAGSVTTILSAHPRLVMNMKGRNRADAFVIAVALELKATVVTGEGSDGTDNRPKIPYVCEQLGVPCYRFLDMIKEEGWSF